MDSSRSFSAEAEADSAQLKIVKEENTKLCRELETSKSNLSAAQHQLKTAEKKYQDQLKDAHKHLEEMRSTLDKTRFVTQH